MTFLSTKSIALVLLILGTCFFLIGLRVLHDRRQPFFNPFDFSSSQSNQSFPLPQRKKVVYGFLPYWTMKKAQIPAVLTHVGYFSISIDRNGNFVTKGDDGLAWRGYKSEGMDRINAITTQQHQNVEVLITMMDADEISAFLLSETAQKTFIKNMREFVRAEPVSGVNIDIEYVGTVDNTIKHAYTTFVQTFSREMRRTDPKIHLSIDVFADSGVKERVWDIPALAPHLDHIVIMAYDFFRSSSPQSGPVAPIFGSDKNRWDIDIVKSLKGFTEQVPAEKFLLGIPFYGYEWRTTSGDPGANTYPKTGALATYKRVQELILERSLSEQWDRDALSPYITYQNGVKTQTIFYENTQSLSYKLDLVNQAGLDGIAIWALGYEGDSPDLWQVIDRKFPVRVNM